MANVTYVPGLNILDCPLVLSTSAQCYLCPWIIPDCPLVLSTSANVTYVPGLNILDCPLVLSTSAQCYLCTWIEYSWLPFGSLYQCPMLSMSLDWTFLIALWFSLPVPNVTYVPGLNILDCPLVLYQCPMLPMSLNWMFLIALWFSLPVSNVTYVPGLNILDCPLVLSTSAQCYLCPLIEYSWLPFGSLYQCPMLPMSLDWTYSLIALWFSLPVPNVTYVPDWTFLIALWFSLPVPNVTWLNILDCPLVLSTSAQYYLCPWIEYSWLLFGSLYQCPMLPMSLDWIFLIALWFSLPVPNVTYVPGLNSRLPLGSLYQCPMLPCPCIEHSWLPFGSLPVPNITYVPGLFLIALWFSLPVPNVTYGLNILDCPLVLSTSAQCYLCPWIEHSWLPFGSLYQCPMLPMSLDWTFLIALWFSTSAQCYLCPWIEYSWLPFGSLYQFPMLPMSLDWTFLIALWFSLPVPKCYLCPWIEYSWLPFGSLYQCPMLPMSLDWIFLIALWFSLPVPNVTYVPGLNILDCPLVLSTSAQC